MLNINELSQLYLGNQGENLAKTIEVDISDWLVDYPNGIITIWHKRNGDAEPYPTGAVMDRDAGVIRWSPTNTDTYVAGKGQAEFRLIEGSVIKKSRTVITGISPSVTYAGDPAGSGWQDYLDAMERAASAAADAQEAAEDAQEAAEDAQEAAEGWAVGEQNGDPVESGTYYQNNSKYYAGQAASSAESAASAAAALIDDTAGDGDTGKVWSADKLHDTFATKADKVASATNNNFAALDANGNLKDSGHKHSDYLTSYDPIFSKETVEIAANSTDNVSYGAYLITHTAMDFGHCYVADYYLSNPKVFAGDITVSSSSGNLYVTYAIRPNSPASTITIVLCKQEDATVTTRLNTGYQYDQIDDTAGDGDTGKVWSADKLHDTFATKADKVASATNNNFAALDANGNLKDSGHKHSDYLTSYNPIFSIDTIQVGANSSASENIRAYVLSSTTKDFGHCYVAGYYLSNPKVFAGDITVSSSSGDLRVDCTIRPNSPASTMTIVLCKQEDATVTTSLNTGYQYDQIDDTAGNGDTDKVWSADKLTDEFATKIGTSSIATTTETQAIINEYGVSA